MTPCLTPKDVGSALAGLTDCLMTTEELAKALRVRRGTVKRWCAEGMPVRAKLGRVFILPSEAAPWIVAHARPSTFDRQSQVYFARRGDRIKIGFSVDPRERLRKMHIDILATVPGDKPTEQAFHKLFHHAALGREWFRPVPELLALIASFAES